MENHQSTDIKKYPKSKNNFQCLGPCYYPETRILHPTLIELTTNMTHPFCPVDEWTKMENGKPVTMISDICLNPTNSENNMTSDLELNALTPHIDFNSEHFLKIYYNLFSFEESIEWLEKNKHVPMGTKMRIMNCSLKVFGGDIELFDTRFADFFIDIVKKRYIKNIYNDVHKYIGYDKETKEIYIISENNNILVKNDYSTERMNFISKTFIEKDEAMKFLMKYIKSASSPRF